MSNNKIRYGVTHPLILNTYCLLRAATKSPTNFFKSFIKDPSLKSGEITVIMCVWDEQENVGRAIQSSYEFVDKYIVVDKNGQTIPLIKEVQDSLNLDVEYYTKPELNLLNSRKYALDKIQSDWVMNQEGDEVFNNARGEPNSIFNLRDYMVYPNIIVKTRMNILQLDFFHTRVINQAPHAFLFHNNGDIYFDKSDIPKGKGREIVLDHIFKWNLAMIKNISRLYYRNTHWGSYERSGLTHEYKSIEEYVEKYLKINVTQEVLDDYERKLVETSVPYDKKIQGEYPMLLRDLIAQGVIR